MFKKSSFGLDVSDESLKFVELISEKDGIRIAKYGECKIPAGALQSGKIKEPKKLEAILKSIKKDFGLSSTRISLSRGDSESISGHLKTFKNSGVSVKSFESKVEAICRSVIPKKDKEAYMVVQFGENSSTVFVVSGGVVNSGVKVASNAVPVLRDAVSRLFLNWHKEGDAGDKKPAIKRIIVCGSGPNLGALSEYLSVSMRHKVELADVWVNIMNTEKYIPEISFEKSFAFAPALGLALKDF